jgi:hypothetical protein
MSLQLHYTTPGRVKYRGVQHIGGSIPQMAHQAPLVVENSAPKTLHPTIRPGPNGAWSDFVCAYKTCETKNPTIRHGFRGDIPQKHCFLKTLHKFTPTNTEFYCNTYFKNIGKEIDFLEVGG